MPKHHKHADNGVHIDTALRADQIKAALYNVIRVARDQDPLVLGSTRVLQDEESFAVIEMVDPVIQTALLTFAVTINADGDRRKVDMYIVHYEVEKTGLGSKGIVARDPYLELAHRLTREVLDADPSAVGMIRDAKRKKPPQIISAATGSSQTGAATNQGYDPQTYRTPATDSPLMTPLPHDAAAAGGNFGPAPTMEPPGARAGGTSTSASSVAAEQHHGYQRPASMVQAVAHDVPVIETPGGIGPQHPGASDPVGAVGAAAGFRPPGVPAHTPEPTASAQAQPQAHLRQPQSPPHSPAQSAQPSSGAGPSGLITQVPGMPGSMLQPSPLQPQQPAPPVQPSSVLPNQNPVIDNPPSPAEYVPVGHEAEDIESTRIVQASPAALQWRLVGPDSTTIPVDGTVIVGRQPTPPPQYGQAQTVRVEDPTFSISKTHAALEIRDGMLQVTDLHSTNGTAVVSPAGGRTDATPGVPLELGHSWRLVIGNVWLDCEQY